VLYSGSSCSLERERARVVVAAQTLHPSSLRREISTAEANAVSVKSNLEQIRRKRKLSSSTEKKGESMIVVGILDWIKLKVVVLLLGGFPVLVLCLLGTTSYFSSNSASCVRISNGKKRWLGDFCSSSTASTRIRTRFLPHFYNDDGGGGRGGMDRSPTVVVVRGVSSTNGEDASLQQTGSNNWYNDETTTVSGHKRSSSISISYVGRGSSAIVRKGSLLLAPSQEYHHLLSKAAIFIYDVGLADDDSEELIARGVIIDHPTAFSVSEMIDESLYFPHDEVGLAAATLGKNTLFRGGDLGEEFVMMLHSLPVSNHHPSQGMIGSSGIYQGGLSYIIDAINKGEKVGYDSIKFFFNYLEFTETQLNLMFHDELENQPGSIDSWISVEVPSFFILHNDYSRGSAWEILRNHIRSNNL
jgi:hypothetical protein